MSNNIKDYYQVMQLNAVKDYAALEVGDGYVLSKAEPPTGVIHTRADAKIIALLEFVTDAPRGYHYHHKKVEHMIVLSGELKCDLSLPEEPDETESLILDEGKQIIILPGCIHTYTALNKNVYALEYSPQRYQASDVVVIKQ